eukprot:scaffold302741_cov12-Tisochrysis_lutea.AAC.1
MMLGSFAIAAGLEGTGEALFRGRRLERLRRIIAPCGSSAEKDTPHHQQAIPTNPQAVAVTRC